MVSTTIAVSGDGLADARDRVEPGLAVHVEVEHEHGRAMRAGEALGVGDGAGLGDDLQRVVGVDQQAQALADDGVVVGDDDRGLAAVRALGAAR